MHRSTALLCALLALPSVASAQAFKPEISPTDPFVEHGRTTRWVKFTIVVNADGSLDDTVQFQDSRTYAFHYDAVTAHLDGFVGLDRSEFDRIALHNSGRKLLLGAVLFDKPRSPWGDGGGIGIGLPLPGLGREPQGPVEFGVQLVGTDPLDRQLVVSAFELVASKVTVAEGKGFYMPTPQQRVSDSDDLAFFARAGVTISDTTRWTTTGSAYSIGWALGRLVEVSGRRISDAIAAGEITADDIVVINDGVPPELPRVAGIVTLTPASDNSHVAILAQTWEIPFVFPSKGTVQDKLRELNGKRVLLRVYTQFASSVGGTKDAVQVDDMTHLDEELVEQILALKAPGQIDFPPLELRGPQAEHLWIDVQGSEPGDARFVGGKAAHFGILHAALGDQSPRAMAFTADLWNAYLDQPAPNQPLRDAIQQTMAKHQTILDAAVPKNVYPADRLGELRADLERLRALIVNTRFSRPLRRAIDRILDGDDGRGGFFPRQPDGRRQRLRFRSSSNLEDGEFSGAGLYESFSGRGDGGRRRDMRRVYASFFNERAVMERLRHRVDESKVFMGVLVHRSFPDEIELANGVATFQAGQNGGYAVSLATQVGAASAVRPEPGDVSELVKVDQFSFVGSLVSLERASSLVQLGEHVLDWSNEQQEYKDLAELCNRVAQRYAEVTGVALPGLDMEYKKVREPDGTARFVVKQVRPLPKPSDAPAVGFLVDSPLVSGRVPALTVDQGEQADVYTLHRLMTIVRPALVGTGFELTEANLNRSIFRELGFRSVQLEPGDDAWVTTRQGDPTSWPGVAFTTRDGVTRVTWERSGVQPGTTSIAFTAPRPVAPPLCPVFLLGEQQLYVEATYDEPVKVQTTWNGGMVTQEAARLTPIHVGALPPGSEERDLSFDSKAGLRVDVSIVWPPGPTGLTAGYTAPLLRWGSTPTVLRGFFFESDPSTTYDLPMIGVFSKTYRPQHHNFGRDFAFEPSLSSGVSRDLKARLRARGIRKIYVNTQNQVFTEDFEGKVEEWPRTVPSDDAGPVRDGMLGRLGGGRR